MKRAVQRAGALALALCCLAVGIDCRAAESAPQTAAEAFILMDAGSGRVLAEKNAERELAIASTTKIMTALVVLEECEPDAPVTILPEATGIEGSSLYLKAGERLTVRELLLGLMLHSGNDAAVALALHCCETVGAFVDRMNETAARLGLLDTSFANPHGLDDARNYSTARDLARLARYALENESFRAIVSTRSATVAGRALTNHNKLLWRVDGAIGVKTGYTRAAGRILVGAAERDGRRLVAVTINAPDDWNDQARLLAYAFSEYHQRTIAECGDLLADVPVISGDRAAVSAAAGETFSCALRADEQIETVLRLPRMVFAPAFRGEPAGYADFYLEGVLLGSIPLRWNESVWETPPQRGLWQRLPEQ